MLRSSVRLLGGGILLAVAALLPATGWAVTTTLQVRGDADQSYQVLDPSGRVVASGQTNAQGRQDNDVDLAPGTYRVRAGDRDVRVTVPATGGRAYVPLPRAGLGRLDLGGFYLYGNRDVMLMTDFQGIGSGDDATDVGSHGAAVSLRFVPEITRLRGSAGILSPFVEGAFQWNDDRATGGLAGQPGFTGLSTVTVDTDFRPRVGLGVEWETPELPCMRRPLRLRPYGGFVWEKGSITTTIDETAFGQPLVRDDKDYTRYSVLYGAQLGVPLCGHGCWGTELTVDVGGSTPVGDDEVTDVVRAPGFGNPVRSSVEFQGGWFVGVGATLNFDMRVDF